MKKLNVLFLLLIASATTISSCTDEKDSSDGPTQTTLEIVFKDENQKPLEGVTLYLFDFTNPQSPKEIGGGKTDAAGKCVFNKNLKNIPYQVKTYGSKTICKQGTASTAGPIPLNQKTTLNVACTAFSLYNIKNLNNTAYNAYTPKNGSYVLLNTDGPIPAGFESSYMTMGPGNYVIKFVPVINGVEDGAKEEVINFSLVECQQITVEYGKN